MRARRGLSCAASQTAATLKTGHTRIQTSGQRANDAVANPTEGLAGNARALLLYCLP